MPDLNAVPDALVEYDATAIGVLIDGKASRNQCLHADSRGGIEEFPQTPVLRFEFRVPFELGLSGEVFPPQALVLAHQGAARTQVVRHPVASPDRKIDCVLEGIDEGRQKASHRIHMSTPVVGGHEHRRQNRHRHHAGQGGRAAFEERLVAGLQNHLRPEYRLPGLYS